MSRIAIEGRIADQPIAVVIGWDRPTQACFLQLELTEEDADNEAFAVALEVSMDVMFKPLTESEVQRNLQLAGVQIPPQAMTALREHVAANAGNTSLKFNAAGICTQIS